MAAIVNADNCTIVGTIEQIAEFLAFVKRAGILNLDGAKFVIVDKPIDPAKVSVKENR